MVLQFDFTQLDFFQREELRKILDVIQLENKGEIVVFAVELPCEFLVLTDGDIELLECREMVTGDIAGNTLLR